MQVCDILEKKAIRPVLISENREDVLFEIAEIFTLCYPDLNLKQENIQSSLLAREQLGSTGIGGGIAIPHARISGLEQMVAVLGMSPQGISYHSIDHQPTHVFFALLTHENSTGEHLKALARICRLLKSATFVEELMSCDSAESIYAKIAEKETLL